MIQWNAIDTVFLDMDGTLLDLAYDNYFWHEYVPVHYGKKQGINLDQAKAVLQGKYRNKAGTLDWYCVDYWSDELGLDILQLKKDIVERIRVFPSVEEFLLALHASRKKVILLTNAHLGSVQVKLAHTRLTSHFDRILSSHSIGHAKETAEFWSLLEKTEDFAGDATLLIDDNLQVLDAARAYGVAHLLCITKPDSTRPVQDTKEYKAISGFHEVMPLTAL